MQSMQPKLLYLSVISLMIFMLSYEKWFLASAILFICIPFIINVLSFFSITEVNLNISRDMTHTVDEGKNTTITLTVHNTGPNLSWVEIEDLVNTELLCEGESNKWLYNFKHNEKKILTYEIKTKRGLHNFKGVQVITGDWLGINKSKKIFDITSTLQVNPILELKDRIEIKSKLLHGFSGLINSKRAGPGVDFFGLREYNNQDSVKNIHWRASAKLQDGFLVKQNLITKNTTAMIDIDTRNHLLPKDDAIRVLEYSLKAARLISDVLINDGHKVGLTAEQPDRNIIVPAQCSTRQKLLINKQLASITEHQGDGPKALVNMPQMFLKNSSSIFIISPLEQSDTKYLLNLKRRGFNVICIAPDYSQILDTHKLNAKELNSIAPIVRHENANHIQLKHQLLVDGLLQKGILVITWDISQPFNHCIHQINLYSRLLNETQYSI